MHHETSDPRFERHQASFQVEPAWYLEDNLVDSPHTDPGPREPRPLLLALHGMGQDALRFHSDLHGQLDERFIVVYPDGPLPLEINEDGGTRREGHAWYIYTGDQERFLASAIRSEAYLHDLIHQVMAMRSVDPRRVYLAGYSQGGYLAGIMALRRPDLFAGVATINSRVKNEIPPDRKSGDAKLPLLVLHGEKDRFIPVEVAEESANRLRDRDFPVTFKRYSSGHRFTEEQIKDLATWLDTIDRATDLDLSQTT